MPDKPLGRKNYGSIPHLPRSRMGPGDHHCHGGQEEICCRKTRDRHDVVIVTEKLDGSNVGVARIGDDVVALGRAGYLASTSKYEQHHLFAAWVRENLERFRGALEPGQRMVGEWLAQAHGSGVGLRQVCSEPHWSWAFCFSFSGFSKADCIKEQEEMTMLTKKNVTSGDWIRAKKPFDFAKCGQCLTQHADYACRLHLEFSRAARRLLGGNTQVLSGAWLRRNFTTIVRLRKRFARFYPKPGRK